MYNLFHIKVFFFFFWLYKFVYNIFQVAVVKHKVTAKVYAMKILNKWEMLRRAEVIRFKVCLQVILLNEPPPIFNFL